MKNEKCLMFRSLFWPKYCTKIIQTTNFDVPIDLNFWKILYSKPNIVSSKQLHISSLVKILVSRNFCHNSAEVKFCTLQKLQNFTAAKFRQINCSTKEKSKIYRTMGKNEILPAKRSFDEIFAKEPWQ